MLKVICETASAASRPRSATPPPPAPYTPSEWGEAWRGRRWHSSAPHVTHTPPTRHTHAPHVHTHAPTRHTHSPDQSHTSSDFKKYAKRVKNHYVTPNKASFGQT